MTTPEEKELFDALTEINRVAFVLQARNFHLQKALDESKVTNTSIAYYDAYAVDVMLKKVAQRVFGLVIGVEKPEQFEYALNEIIQNVKAGK